MDIQPMGPKALDAPIGLKGLPLNLANQKVNFRDTSQLHALFLTFSAF
tara:strand:- start:482 stop:625 length:144 start_codon:yes stop_codon:yes gene_type:complete